jgi:hypothetical protein
LNFEASYTFYNSLGKTRTFILKFYLPAGSENVKNIEVNLDRKACKDDSDYADEIDWNGNLAPNEKKTISIKYKANGPKKFTYKLEGDELEIKNLFLL